MNLTITKPAQSKIDEIIKEDGNPNLKLRMFIQVGGCSGMQYGFTLDEVINDDDWQIETSGASVLVDFSSAQYLEGAVIDYEETLEGANFKISNPSATSTCGCGSSFGI